MQEEKVLLSATLCFLVKDKEVSLAKKKKKIGQGCWNGYGGGIKLGETPVQAALRELFEEAKVIALPENLEKVAVIDFHNTKTDGTTFICKVHVYMVYQWQGEPKETEEMGKPKWFEKEFLPLGEMMLADRKWLPIVLSGKKITAEFYYRPFQKRLWSEEKIQLVEFFPVD